MLPSSRPLICPAIVGPSAPGAGAGAGAGPAARVPSRTGLGRVLGALGVAAMLAGCASTTPTQTASTAYDPIEGVNRTTFAVNNTVDVYVLDPIAEGYIAVVPPGARRSVGNFLRNLNAPIDLLNQLLQGDLDGAGVVVERFFLNSTVGVLGLFDFATDAGIPYEPEDFGQTLAVWGVAEGPYLVLPLIGPSSTRDTVGLVVDAVTNPVGLYLNITGANAVAYGRIGAEVLDGRASADDALEDLRANSSDYYAALRSAYLQRRQSLIEDGATPLPTVTVNGEDDIDPSAADPNSLEPETADAVSGEIQVQE